MILGPYYLLSQMHKQCSSPTKASDLNSTTPLLNMTNSGYPGRRGRKISLVNLAVGAQVIALGRRFVKDAKIIEIVGILGGRGLSAQI